jgi:hypothetical protein
MLTMSKIAAMFLSRYMLKASNILQQLKQADVTLNAFPLKTVFLQKNSLPHQGLASIKVS